MEHVYKYYRGKDRTKLQALLRDKGFYSTEGRLKLLALLKKSEAPRSVPDVTRRLGKNLDEANVYRSLEALADAGILSRSDIRKGGAHYELPHGHHHHVVCNDCGSTEDVGECADKHLERRVLLRAKNFKTIQTHALEFFGTCRDCAQNV